MNQKLNSILLIDDDEPTNFLSTMLIEEADCTRHLKILQSAHTALNYLHTPEISANGTSFIPPDLIFLDINMPCMDGWEFVKEYKKLLIPTLKKTVIIMLTTSLNPDDKLKAECMPEISGFEIKPLTKEIITQTIKKYFSAEELKPGVINHSDCT